MIVTPSEEFLLGFGLVWYLDNDIGSPVQNDSQTSIKAGRVWREHLSIPSEFASHVYSAVISIRRAWSPSEFASHVYSAVISIRRAWSPSWLLIWLISMYFPSIYYRVTCYNPEQCDVLTRRKWTEPYHLLLTAHKTFCRRERMLAMLGWHAKVGPTLSVPDHSQRAHVNCFD